MSHPNPYEARAREKEVREARGPVVVAKCVGCGHKREIGPDEVPEGQQPACEKCFMPMVATEARPHR